MITQPWAVTCWPRVVWPNPIDLAPQLSHLATNILPDQTESPGRQGQTIWWASIEGKDGAIAWDWVEVRDGVVALVDPMTLASNIGVESIDSESERIVALNEWVHQTPWQSVVRAAIRLSAPSTLRN